MESPKQDISPTFNVKNYILKLVAYWYLFAISLIIGFTYNYFNKRFKVNTYATSTTLIMYDDLQSTQAVVGGLELFGQRKNFENEVGVLKSYSLNQIALSELDFNISYFKNESFKSDIDLYKNSPFIIVPDSGQYMATWLKFHLEFISKNEFIISIEDKNIKQKTTFNKRFQSDYGSFKIIKNERLNIDYNSLVGKKYYFYKNDFNSLVNNFRNRLNVDLRSVNSSILWLWIEGTVPQRIVDYLNKVSEIYLRQSLEGKNKIVLNTIDFIDQQLEGVIDSLDNVENKLQIFKQNSKVLDVGKEAEILFEELDELQKEKKIINIKQSFYEYLVTNIEEHGVLTSSVSPTFLGITDPVLESLLNSYQKLLTEKEILNYDVKKNLPNLDVLNLKLKAVQREIDQHVKNSMSNIDANLEAINKKVAQVDFKLRRIPSVQRKIQNIQRNYKLNDNIYTFLLQRRTEAGITMASNSPGAKLLDAASIQNVINKTPKAGESSTKIVFICLLIPILIIVAKEFLNNKIIDKSDIDKKVTIPMLGSISRSIRDESIPAFNRPKSPVAESFRLLKTNLQYLLVDKPNPIISVNSTISGEGKTFCAINLAVLVASSNKKTLIIGLDLRKPKAHFSFEHPNIIGLSNYLSDNYAIDDILFETQIPNLTFLPSGPVPPNPAELIESDRMFNLIKELKSRFDYIIVDTPPVAHVADALIISKFTDAHIYVIRQNYSSKNVLSIAQDLYTSKKMKNMGILINDVNQSTTFGLKYGYGFGYGFSYGYGYEEGQGYYDDTGIKPGVFKRIGIWFYNKLKSVFS